MPDEVVSVFASVDLVALPDSSASTLVWAVSCLRDRAEPLRASNTTAQVAHAAPTSLISEGALSEEGTVHVLRLGASCLCMAVGQLLSVMFAIWRVNNTLLEAGLSVHGEALVRLRRLMLAVSRAFDALERLGAKA